MGDYPDFHVVQSKIFGAPLLQHGTTTGSATGVKTLLSVDGRGTILGGLIHCATTASVLGDSPTLEIDGVDVSDMTFNLLRTYNLTDFTRQLLTLTVYDPVNWLYTVSIRPEITFASNVTLKYDAASATLRQYHYEFMYTLL